MIVVHGLSVSLHLLDGSRPPLAFVKRLPKSPDGASANGFFHLKVKRTRVHITR